MYFVKLKEFLEKINRPGNPAPKFTRHALEATVCGYALLIVYMHSLGAACGVEYFKGMYIAERTAEHLLCAGVLSLCGGMLIDAVWKHYGKDE